jgi:hypothetical protein
VLRHASGAPSSGASLEIVDTRSWTLVRNVPLGTGGPTSIAVPRSGYPVYVGQRGPLAVDPMSGASIGSVTAPTDYVVLSPDESRIYAAGSRTLPSEIMTVSTLDAASLAVLDQVTIPSSFSVTGLGVSPDDRSLVVPYVKGDGSSDGVTFVHTTGCLGVDGMIDAAYTSPVAVPKELRWPTFTPDGHVLMWSPESEFLLAFDVTTRAQTLVLDTMASWSKMFNSWGGTLAYDPRSNVAVGSRRDATIAVVNLSIPHSYVVALPGQGSNANVVDPDGHFFAAVIHGTGSDTLHGLPPVPTTVDNLQPTGALYTFSGSDNTVVVMKIVDVAP